MIDYVVVEDDLEKPRGILGELSCRWDGTILITVERTLSESSKAGVIAHERSHILNMPSANPKIKNAAEARKYMEFMRRIGKRRWYRERYYSESTLVC